MDPVLKTSLELFAEKASRRLRDKKQFSKRTLSVPSMTNDDGTEGTIVVRGLTDSEVNECVNYESDDSNGADKYAVYLACIEPNLKDLAMLLKEQGEIVTPMDVVGIFYRHEISEIAMEIMKLSGVIGDKKVHVINNLKN